MTEAFFAIVLRVYQEDNSKKRKEVKKKAGLT
jgi:hypothetical protein